ncbi:MAG: SMC-Scp complex subunit ScpB [Thermodesulfovibrionales bacterium]
MIETLLFVSAEPATLASLKNSTDIPEADIVKIMEELIREYQERDGGILIVEVANGYQMVTNPRFAQWLRKFLNVSTSNKLSTPALETLAIIAYKQPLIKAEIEEIRGVNSDGVIKNLLDKRLIKIIGKKEVPGKPLLYGTTREFLQYFGLKDLTELPSLRELAREDAA